MIELLPGELRELNAQLIWKWTPGDDTYYSPFGGVRIACATEAVVPDVPPFTADSGRTVHPGGDYILTGFSRFVVYYGAFYPRAYEPVMSRLHTAYPTVWDPPAAMVQTYLTNVTERDGSYMWGCLLVMATSCSCQPYWDSLEALARMIAGRHEPRPTIPDDWVLEYGTTCPTCDGTGLVPGRGPGTWDVCRTCNGLGKVLRIDLRRGLRDYIRYPVYATEYGGSLYLTCPYCSTRIYGSNRLEIARILLNHIIEVHPNRPLTEPRLS